MTLSSPTAAELGVSRETYDRLAEYVALIRKWSPHINLISKSTLSDIWARHIADSLQIAQLRPGGSQSWLDLGSGGGLPGVVVAILYPELLVIMVESDLRKAAFLTTCIQTLNLNARVERVRIEGLTPQGAKVVSARALAPLPLLLEYVERHLAPDGTAILPKGRQAEQELAEARKTWSFDCDCIPSLTEPGAQILRIERITRA